MGEMSSSPSDQKPAAATPGQLRTLVLRRAAELGFQLSSVARIAEFPVLGHFADWIGRGFAGEMSYLARRVGEAPPARDGAKTTPTAPPPAAPNAPFLREDIRHAFPWANSAICCGVVYNAPLPRSTEAATDEVHKKEHGWISRYAWGDDYHDGVLAKMRLLAETLRETAHSGEVRTYVDTGPFVERIVAREAGLGWTGKNTCLINQQAGSYFFLATLLTSQEIEADSPVTDRCGSCTRCLDACPTGALAPYLMDASRCIAYLTIELRGAIPGEFRQLIGQHVFGCDICQDVCPWNGRAAVTTEPEFQPRPGLYFPALAELAALNQEQYRERFRNSAMKRAKYQGFMRNVALAMGNSGNRAFVPHLRRLAASEDATIREQAEWSLERLQAES